MNKTNDSLHRLFTSGHINGAVYSYLTKLSADLSAEDSSSLLEYAASLEELGAKNEEDCANYFKVYLEAPELLEKITGAVLSETEIFDLCKFAAVNKYSLYETHEIEKIVRDYIKYAELNKGAYPNVNGIESDYTLLNKPYNIEKWLTAMREIYNLSNTSGQGLESCLEHVVGSWSKKEKLNFERWMKYYRDGEHLKYAKKNNINKIAFSPTEDMPTGFGAVENPFTAKKVDPVAQQNKSEQLTEAQRKLLSRLSSMDKLVYQYRDVFPRDVSQQIVDILHDLNKRIRFLTVSASIQDCLIRGAGQLNKRGFIEGAKELKKIAQELEEGKLPIPSPAQTNQAPSTTVQPNQGQPQQAPMADSAPAAEQGEQKITEINIPNIQTNNDAIEIPDFNSPTLQSALTKLEEVNKVISERNVVRALAAVDIILGQLGIASYFPALSEAQSKLMDAFNYAGSRVAEVIGMMRGGQLEGAIKANEQPAGEAAAEEGDTVEVTEEAEKPIQQIVTNPPAAQPAAKPPVS